MTDHPTPATPEATEREARADAVRRIDDVGLTRHQPHNVRLATKIAAYQALDAYAAAVRRADRERIAGIVEGMQVLAANERDYYFSLRHVEPPYTDKDECYVIERDAILTKLREEL